MENSKRNVPVKVYMTDEEKAALQQAADDMDMNISDYIRYCIDHNDGVPEFRVMNDDVRGIEDELGAIALILDKMANGIKLVNNVTAGDITAIQNEFSEILDIYESKLKQVKSGRSSAEKMARRMAKEWKRSQKEKKGGAKDAVYTGPQNPEDAG